MHTQVSEIMKRHIHTHWLSIEAEADVLSPPPSTTGDACTSFINDDKVSVADKLKPR